VSLFLAIVRKCFNNWANNHNLFEIRILDILGKKFDHVYHNLPKLKRHLFRKPAVAAYICKDFWWENLDHRVRVPKVGLQTREKARVLIQILWDNLIVRRTWSQYWQTRLNALIWYLLFILCYLESKGIDQGLTFSLKNFLELIWLVTELSQDLSNNDDYGFSIHNDFHLVNQLLFYLSDKSMLKLIIDYSESNVNYLRILTVY
jgi:hypothetical protein